MTFGETKCRGGKISVTSRPEADGVTTVFTDAISWPEAWPLRRQRGRAMGERRGWRKGEREELRSGG